MVGFVPISGYKCSKNQSGRPDLNRRPLDPQSRRQVISMFPQIKPAHRRAEQSGTAHWRAPVIPTSFPAALPLWAWHGAAASRPRGGTGALSYHLLAGARQGATACPGRGQPITTVGPGEWLQPAFEPPVQRSGVDCRAVVSLSMNARRPGTLVPGMRWLPNVDKRPGLSTAKLRSPLVAS